MQRRELLSTKVPSPSSHTTNADYLFHIHTLPRQAAHIELRHEGIWIKLLHIPHASLHPLSGDHHLGPDHGRHARGVRNGLRTHLGITRLVVADIVNIHGLFLAVLEATHDVAYAGLALGEGTEGSGVRQKGTQKL